MDNILFIAIVLLLVLCVLIFVKLNKPKTESDGQALIQQQLISIQSSLNQQLQSNSESITQSIKNTQDQQQQFIQTVNKLVNESSNQIVNIVSKQNQTLDTRLNAVNFSMKDLQQSQGRMEQAGEEVRKLAQDFVKFEELLKAPKLRGGLGETMLEEILRQVIPKSFYDTQYKFKNGTIVDAVIKLSHGILPIDAKFPRENFQKYYVTQDETQRNQFYKLFINDVKKHINDISDKYILPSEGTLDFALMYIPAENIYYETIIKWDSASNDETLLEYSRKKKVVPVSPNTFYSHLQIIAIGFKGMEVESNAKIILQTLDQLKGDLNRFIDDYNVIGRHLQNAKNKYDEAAREIDKFKSTLDKPTQQSLLPE